jgi:hypothetical protein
MACSTRCLGPWRAGMNSPTLPNQCLFSEVLVFAVLDEGRSIMNAPGRLPMSLRRNARPLLLNAMRAGP